MHAKCMAKCRLRPLPMHNDSKKQLLMLVLCKKEYVSVYRRSKCSIQAHPRESSAVKLGPPAWIRRAAASDEVVN
jgi:hypothetical protein